MKKKYNLALKLSILGILLLVLAYVTPKVTELIHLQDGYLNWLVFLMVVVGYLLVVISTIINPKIGAIPFLLLSFLFMSNIVVQPGQSEMYDEGVVSQLAKGFPFQVYTSVSLNDLDGNISFKEHHDIKGYILNFVVGVIGVLFLSIREVIMKVIKVFTRTGRSTS